VLYGRDAVAFEVEDAGTRMTIADGPYSDEGLGRALPAGRAWG
jgi:hypothetical protein